jgi:glycosyltransferase involved in cell wall biosynthesis
MRKIFILVPSDIDSSPITGAYALANGAHRAGRDVTLVAIKSDKGAVMPLQPGIRKLALSELAPEWLARRRIYRQMLKDAGGRAGAASISLCFSADLLNSTCSDAAVTISSVRGNLLEGYRLKYGFAGPMLARIHYARLRRFDAVAAMSRAMEQQLHTMANVNSFMAGNFIDEPVWDSVRHQPLHIHETRFVFVGSLTHGKQPLQLLEAIAALVNEGRNVHVDYVGEGPLRPLLMNRAAALGLEKHMVLHGFVPRPFQIVARANVMVLPSLSEGVSRAALEALYIGIPCVARTIDANGELITDGVNGALFEHDGDLPGAMIRASLIERATQGGRSLLPSLFRQSSAVTKYLEQVDSVP